MAYEHEHDEWGRACVDLSEFDRARTEDPETYDDMMTPNGARWL